MLKKCLVLAVVISLVFVFSVQPTSAYNIEDMINYLRNLFFPFTQSVITGGTPSSSCITECKNRGFSDALSCFTCSSYCDASTPCEKIGKGFGCSYPDDCCFCKCTWMGQSCTPSSGKCCYSECTNQHNLGGTGYKCCKLEGWGCGSGDVCCSGTCSGGTCTAVTGCNTDTNQGCPAGKWCDPADKQCKDCKPVGWGCSKDFWCCSNKCVSGTCVGACDTTKTVVLSADKTSTASGTPVKFTIKTQPTEQGSAACSGKTAMLVVSNKNVNSCTLQQKSDVTDFWAECQVEDRPSATTVYWAFVDATGDGQYQSGSEPQKSSEMTITVESPCKGQVSVSYNPDKTEYAENEPFLITVTGRNETPIKQKADLHLGLFEVDCDTGKKKSDKPENEQVWSDKTFGKSSTISGSVMVAPSPGDAGKCYASDVFFCTKPFDGTNPCYKLETQNVCWQQAAFSNVHILYEQKQFKVIPAPTTSTTTTISSTTTTTQSTTTTQPTTTTTIPGPTTTTQPTTTTTISTSFIVECKECFAGSKCECNISKICEEGTWIIKNKPGTTPLQSPVVEIIPPIKVEYTPTATGQVEASATCTKPTYTPATNKITVEVKEEFLKCPAQCDAYKECSCKVNGCEDGDFEAILGSTILKKEKITTKSYTGKFIPEKGGTIEVTADCVKPDKKAQATIFVTGVTPTTISERKFIGRDFRCTSTSTGYRCSLDYSNDYGTAYLVFILSKSTGEVIDDSGTITVGLGSGIKETTFSCSGRSGRHYVSWTAFSDPDLANPIPGAWPNPDEREEIVC